MMPDKWLERIDKIGQQMKNVGLPYATLFLTIGLIGFIGYSLGHAVVNLAGELSREWIAIQQDGMANQTAMVGSLVSQLENQGDEMRTRGSEHKEMSEAISALTESHREAVESRKAISDAMVKLLNHFIDEDEGAVKNEPTEPTPGGT